jgi:hypothetical protein
VSRRVKVPGDWFHGQVPHGAVYVGRAAPGLRKSPYANPFKIGRDAVDAAEAKQLYRLHAEGFDVATLRRDLAGKDIACWCPLDQPCHADVLLELANP